MCKMKKEKIRKTKRFDFRLTEEEHAQLIEKALAAGYVKRGEKTEASISNFIRQTLLHANGENDLKAIRLSIQKMETELQHIAKWISASEESEWKEELSEQLAHIQQGLENLKNE